MDKIPDGWVLCDGKNNTPSINEDTIKKLENKIKYLANPKI